MENEFMLTRTWNLKSRSGRFSLLAGGLFVLGVVAYGQAVFAQTSATKTFSSAHEAANALFQAAKNGDEQQLEAILGAGEDVTSSGDEVEDKLEREQFTKKYQEMHRLVREPDGSTILYIGAENWPFPIPVASSNGVWRFDSDAGKKEIMFRRIGENEFTAIEVCDAFAAATKQPGAGNTGDDAIAGYVQSLASISTTDSGSPAPESKPFHGYYFQREKASGQVSLIAYPAKYRSSGVMTFVVTQKGVVYEKDLGPNTTTAAQTVRKTDSSWNPAE
jgi:Protein of unknown function (DUF2950)